MVQPAISKHASLSHDSAAGLRAVLQRSLQRVLPGGQGSTHWTIAALQDGKEILEQDFVMLTISACTFRVIVLIHYTFNDALMVLVSELLKTTLDKLNAERILDCLNELGNSLCGEIKRDLSQVCPHLGMSTPNRLNRNNLTYIGDLSMTFDTHWRVLHDGNPVLAVSLYACAYADVDFRSLREAQNTAPEGVSALELF